MVRQNEFLCRSSRPKVLSERCYEKFREIHKRTSVLENQALAQVFSYKIYEICKNYFLQNTTWQLLLIEAVSIVAKGELYKNWRTRINLT